MNSFIDSKGTLIYSKRGSVSTNFYTSTLSAKLRSSTSYKIVCGGSWSISCTADSLSLLSLSRLYSSKYPFILTKSS